MDQHPTRMRGEAKRNRGDGMRWCQTRHECEGTGIKPFGSSNDVGDKHRITPRSKVDWIDTGGLSTAGLKHRDQGFKRRGYSVDRLQRSDGGPMGGPPLNKRQSTVTSVARCDYGPPPLAGPKLKRQRPHTGLERPWMVIRSRCTQSLEGLMDKRRRRALEWTSTLPVCVVRRNDIEVTA